MDFISRASRFCESVQPIGIAQPIDAWSCGIFVLIGLGILWRSRKTGQFIHGQPLYSYLFALFIAIIGLTSFWNHATLSYWGGTADVASMYVFVSYLILLLFSRLIPQSPSKLLIWLVIANIPLAYVASIEGPITDYVFGFLVGALILSGIVTARRRPLAEARNFIIAIGWFLLGFLVWSLDIRGIWCSADSLIQWHAFWHVFTALAGYFFYLYLLPKNDVTAD